jgi:O-antigen/teichoic acid export membrane protein
MTPERGTRVFRSTAIQGAGRIIISVLKVLAYARVVRGFGPERFGEYALITAILAVGETIVDFGLTDLAVASICQNPARRVPILRNLARGKVAMSVAAFALVSIYFYVLDFEPHVLKSGLVGGISLLFFAVVVVYRAHFKARVELHREVLAELISTVVLVALIDVARIAQAGLEWLLYGFVVSRMVFAGLCTWFARKEFRLSPRDLLPSLQIEGFRPAVPIGILGVIVVLNVTLDPVILAKVADENSVGQFAAAFRFGFPVVMVINGFAASVYPLLAASWPSNRDEARAIYQKSIDSACVASAGLVVVFQSCSQFIMTALMGPRMAEAGFVLRDLSWSYAVMCLTGTVAPVLFVLGGQWYALASATSAIVMHASLNLILVPEHRAFGAAWSSAITEFSVALVPTVWFVQRLLQYRIRWFALLRAGAAAACSLLPVFLFHLEGSALGGIVAIPLYVILAVAFGAVRCEDLARFRSRRAARSR